ncbi:MAG: Tn3 family transposase [Burkholderiales bacterium]|jgi:hypothetical protein|nr:Tn3 family transposase [Burkholderiales bacterium]
MPIPAKNKNLRGLSDAEQAAYYEAPDFSEDQRYKFLTLTQNELNRYEYWLYSKILDSIKSGDTYFTASLHYRNLSDELVPQDKKDTVPHYSFDFGVLHGAVDGQKFTMATPTIKARHGKKYFGKGKGVVAYSLLCNHVLLQTYLLGSNDHESYFAFDIWYNNSSEINLQMLTGDMHILNKANSVIMYWFDGELCPRFTNTDRQLQHLYCEKWLDKYDSYDIKPRSEINRKLIEDEAENLERIIATLGSGEVSQASLIKKLCTYKQEHKTQEALYEMDKLVRSNQILQQLLP